MLAKFPQNRLSAEEALNDPWVKTFTEKSKIAKPICINALTLMKNFHCERRLDRAVLCYITNFMNSQQNEEKL